MGGKGIKDWNKSEDLPLFKICSGLNRLGISLKKLILQLALFPLVSLQLSVFAGDPDTLLIAPVTITNPRITFYSEDTKCVSIDSLELARNFTMNIGEFLAQHSTLSVSSYGGFNSLTSISFRGTGSNHTLVTWHGFPVNSLTTGGVDLSLIPVGIFDKISLVYGASGSLYGSSSIGGSIMLENRTDWTNRLSGGLSAGMGSFGYRRYGLECAVGNDWIQYSISGFFNRSDDDFWFTDTQKSGNPKVQLDHNKLVSYSVLQDLQVKLPGNNTLGLGIWYLEKEKEIPEIMGSYGVSNQVQKDSLLKGYIQWSKRTARSNLIIKSAYLMDFLRYTDKLDAEDENYIIDSKIESHRLLNDVNLKVYLNHFVSFDIGGTFSYLTVHTSNYRSDQGEMQGDIFGGIKAQLGNWVTNLTLRKVFTPYKDPGLLYSAGIKVSSHSNRITGRMNLSNKFRTPGFNEKYWQPGGNRDLKPEKGWGLNLGAEWLTWKSDDGTGNLRIDADAYTSHINNWIQWAPSEVNGIWSPVNYKKVWTRGVETSLILDKNWEELSCRFTAGYACTRSTTENSSDGLSQNGNQLKYVPVHAVNGSLKVQFRGVYFVLSNQFTGARYTTEENDPLEKINPYNLNNLLLGMHFGPKDNVTLQARITNVFNINYQVIRSYPMPGRGFYVNVVVGLKQDKRLK